VEPLQQGLEHSGLFFNCITSILVGTQSYHLQSLEHCHIGS